MERDREIKKLTNVLRRIARAAGHAAWSGNNDATRFCVLQYNKVFGRLGELEPSVSPLFTTLSEHASADVTRIAAQELAAYFEDESAATFTGFGGVRVHSRGCGGRRGWGGRVRVGSCG